MATETTNCERVDKPQFNQRNVQAFLDYLSNADSEEQNRILGNIQEVGILDFLCKHFTVDRNFLKAIDAAPDFIISQIQSSLITGIPAAAKFVVSMPDMFIGDETNGSNPSKLKRRKTTIVITIEPVEMVSGADDDGNGGLVGVVNWNLFGGR